MHENSNIKYCIWCSALGVVAEVLRSRCVVLCTGVSLYPVHKTTHQLLRTSATTPSAEHRSSSSIIRIKPNTPEDGHIDARNM